MRIAVLIKQVPAVDTVKIDEKTGTMVRDGVEAELNPLDLHAVEAAIRVVESRPEGETSAVVVSMGPPLAKKAIAQAIAMGCTSGALISDRKFGGSDTLATSRALAGALRKLGPFDLVFVGERATDGETGQVGPAVAELLGIPALTYVSSIEELTDGKIRVTRAVEDGTEEVESPLPAMVMPLKAMNSPRLCTLRGKLRAKTVEIPSYGAADLDVPEEQLGLKGSPTQVIKINYPKMTRQGARIAAVGRAEEAAAKILKFCEDKNCIGGER